MHYFPNNLRELRGRSNLSHHVLSRACGLGVGRLRTLEEQGLPSEVSRASLEALAAKLQVPLTQLFPTFKEGPSSPPLPFVSDLIEEQTTPKGPTPKEPRQRKVRLLPPALVDGAWEIALDSRVANRSLFQDLLLEAEERGGWKSLARRSILVRGDKKFSRTILVFPEEEIALKFHADWADRPYTPDPPNPVVEVVHRHVPGPNMPVPVVADIDEPPEAEEEPPNPEPLPKTEDEDEDNLLVISAKLTPRLLGYYRELKRQYGGGIQKALLIRGLTAMASDFDL